MLQIDYLGKAGSHSFDISSEATTPFGFLYQDRVKTPLGDASVIGVCDGKLWFHVDGDQGASFWSKCVNHEDFVKRGFVTIASAEDPTKVDPLEFHKLKKVTYADTQLSLVMQNINGPCPIIAVANALILRGDLKVIANEKSSVVSSKELRAALLDHIKQSTDYKIPEGTPQQLKDRTTLCGHEGDIVKMNEARSQLSEAQLQKFYAGIDVSPLFTAVDGFDYEQDVLTFALANVRLVHGWIISENDAKYGPLREFSYDDLMLVMTDESSDHSNIAQEFVNQHSSQLTEVGLQCLKESLVDGEVCVLFRNNHFSTVLKAADQLFIVVSDEGYSDRQCVVFEELNLQGGGAFRDGNLYPVEEYVLSVVAECGNKYSDEEIRTTYAAMISEDMNDPSIQNIIDRLKSQHQPNSRQQSSIGDPQVSSVTTANDVTLALDQLVAMGFDKAKCEEAMAKCGSVEQAIEMLTQ